MRKNNYTNKFSTLSLPPVIGSHLVLQKQHNTMASNANNDNSVRCKPNDQIDMIESDVDEGEMSKIENNNVRTDDVSCTSKNNNNDNNNGRDTNVKMKRKMKSRSQRKRNRRLREANTKNSGNERKIHDPMKSLQSNAIQLQDALLQTKVVRLCLPRMTVEQSTNTDDANLHSSDTNYITEIPNGPWIRVIEPYPYTFTSNVKGRWVGRTVLDVYTTEFGSYPPSYYDTAIQQGRIRVSNKVVPSNYIIQGNDVLTHSVHRHEPAVAVSYHPESNDATESQCLISIVANTDQVLAVDKPSTMPVHPCGGYYQNTLMAILENMKSSTDDNKLLYGKLHTIHRLDRLTSGLVILAKSSQVATEWGKAIQRRDECEKLYVTRVRGNFVANSTGSLLRNSRIRSIHDNENNSNEPKSGKQIPYHGEWNQDKSKADSDSVVDNARKRNALGYWITDQNNNLRQDVTLEEFSSIHHTIDEWLDVLNVASASSNKTKSSATSNDNHEDDPRLKSFLWFNIACPVRIEQHKNGVCAAGSFDDLDDSAYVKTVKPAETSFAIVKYNADDNTTVLLARPKTGRTHQIRIHLQYLNFPIANDPNYGGSLWFGNPIGEQACKQAQRILNATISTADGENDGDDDVCMPTVNCIRQEIDSSSVDHSRVIADEPATENEINRILQLPQRDDETFHNFICRTCVWCARMEQKNRYTKEQRDHLEFLVRSPGLWLHALQYTVKGISFRTAIPTWSQ